MFRAEILWLANGPTLKMDGKLVGAVFAARGVYAIGVCEALGLPVMPSIPTRRYGSRGEKCSTHPHAH